MTCALKLFEGLEPGSGFVTTTTTEPTWDAEAVPVAVSCELETNVVERFVPPKDTVAPLTKALPETVSEIAPTLNCEGETLEICGMGFQSVTTLVLVTDWFDC